MRDYSHKAAFVLGKTATGLMLMSGGLDSLSHALNGAYLTGGIELGLGLSVLAGNLALPCVLASASLATHSGTEMDMAPTMRQRLCPCSCG
jgi:hypothetical protein